MDREQERLNTSLLCGWSVITITLLGIYFGEMLKHAISPPYFAIFAILISIPNLTGWLVFIYNKNWLFLKYFVTFSFLIMYTFTLFTGNTILCFTYIFPIILLLILYYDPTLIIVTGLFSTVLNITAIFIKTYNKIDKSGGKDMEIQLAIIILCFAAAYIVSKFYKRNTDLNLQNTQTIINQIEQINKMSLQTITTIANIIDARDNYTKGHSTRVADYTALLAYKLGMNKNEIEDIHSIALLHDIGKLGIPDSILNKPGKLTNEEYQVMKNHTVIGGNILKDMSMLKDIDLGAKYHHERYDGKGYPDGLKGEQIPYIARIISVADAFDAMTSDRVYRKHLDSIIVINELEKGKSTQFDPVIADAMLSLIKSEKIKMNYNALLEEIDLAENLNELYPEKEFYDATE